jgi:hypothetical protein
MMSELLERLEEVKDTDDMGFGGKNFEKALVKALKLAGMKFHENVASGPGWDIHTVGDEWLRLISEKDVNIKVCGTKWMFASSELAKALPWDKLPEDYSTDRAEKKARNIINKKGIYKIVFLKPKSKDIQGRIVKAANEKDVEAAKGLMIKKNFKFEKLGKGYGIRVLDNGERVTSIALLKDGKVFMRSEKPRQMSKGNALVTFRTPTANISKVKRAVARMNESLRR